MLVGESGKEIAFGDLIHERGQAVVVFLRHLWCVPRPLLVVVDLTNVFRAGAVSARNTS